MNVISDMKKFSPKMCRDCRSFMICKYRERFSHGDIPGGLRIIPKTSLRCGMKVKGDMFGRG